MRVIFFIDSVNAFAKYGVFVSRYGYKQLVQMPNLKKVESNDWLEQDGIEVDLSAPQLDTRNIDINFFATNTDISLEFIEMLSSKVYHTFYFPEIGRTYKLRLVSEGSRKINLKMGSFTLKFADDFPFWGYEHTSPLPIGLRPSKYKLDNIDFSDYGVLFLDGTDDSVLKSPDIKPNFIVNNSDMSGALYGGKTLMFRPIGATEIEPQESHAKPNYKDKDVTLKCIINTPLAVFWRNYNALFWDLTRPELRSFCINAIGVNYPCYYVSSSVTKFDILTNGRVWCEFSIKIKITRFRWYAPKMLNIRLNSDYTPRLILSNGSSVFKLINNK